MRSFAGGPRLTQRRDHVLMSVMRKLDRELPFVLWFCRLVGIVRLAETEACLLARRGSQVTDRANRRSRSGDGLAGKKLLPVTAHAGIMIGKVRDIGEFS